MQQSMQSSLRVVGHEDQAALAGEQHRQAFASADAKMITTVRANLQRLLEFAFVKVGFATVALNEDIFRLYDALLRRHRFDLFTLLAKPGHKETVLLDLCSRVYRDEAEVSTGGRKDEGND